MTVLDIFILIIIPLIISISSLLSLARIKKSKKWWYIIPIAILNVGILLHFIGLFIVRGFEGTAVSLMGAIILLIGIAILIIQFMLDWYRKLPNAKAQKEK